MWNKYTYQFVFQLLLFGLLVFFSANVFGQEDPMLSALINSQNATKEISQKELTSIMLGERQRWADGRKIKIAILKPGSGGSDYISLKVVNMDGHEFNKHWLALIFQGKASCPKYFSTENAMVNYIESNNGAIGVCNEIMAKDKSILTIDGKSTF